MGIVEAVSRNSSHGLEMLEKYNLKERLGSKPVIEGG